MAQVAAGSADSFVYVWDAKSPTPPHRIAYKLPGHAGSVNEVDFHPSQVRRRMQSPRISMHLLVPPW